MEIGEVVDVVVGNSWDFSIFGWKIFCEKKIVLCIDLEIKKGIFYCLMFFILGEL